jgi:hypothetical protein
MQANELKIGNWVKTTISRWRGEPCRVIAIKEDMVSFSKLSDGQNTWVMLGDLRPIPLTPEILENAGFEKASPKCYELWVREGGYSKYVFYWNDGDDMYVGYDGGSYGRKIKYLHDLQNRYFSLTGTELEINL